MRVEQNIVLALGDRRGDEKHRVLVLAYKFIPYLLGRRRMRKILPIRGQISLAQPLVGYRIRNFQGNHPVIIGQGGQGKMHRDFGHRQGPVLGCVEEFHAG